jgi:hypothetical protein
MAVNGFAAVAPEPVGATVFATVAARVAILVARFVFVAKSESKVGTSIVAIAVEKAEFGSPNVATVAPTAWANIIACAVEVGLTGAVTAVVPTFATAFITTFP